MANLLTLRKNVLIDQLYASPFIEFDPEQRISKMTFNYNSIKVVYDVTYALDAGSNIQTFTRTITDQV